MGCNQKEKITPGRELHFPPPSVITARSYITMMPLLCISVSFNTITQTITVRRREAQVEEKLLAVW